MKKQWYLFQFDDPDMMLGPITDNQLAIKLMNRLNKAYEHERYHIADYAWLNAYCVSWNMGERSPFDHGEPYELG